MLKRLLILALAMLMMIGVFGFAGCNDPNEISLTDYKMEGKEQIDADVASKTQSDYSLEEWAEVLDVATEGKQAVDAAKDKTEVDSLITATKATLNAVERKGNPLQASSYDDASCKPLDSIWLGYTIDRSRLTVGNDLALKLYYGPSEYPDRTECAKATAKIDVERVIYIKTSKPYDDGSRIIDRSTLKTMEDFKDDTKYPNIVGIDGDYVNSAYEDLTIPADWFIGDKGVFVWFISANYDWTHKSPTGANTGISLYYVIQGNTIFLLPFDDYYDQFKSM